MKNPHAAVAPTAGRCATATYRAAPDAAPPLQLSPPRPQVNDSYPLSHGFRELDLGIFDVFLYFLLGDHRELHNVLLDFHGRRGGCHSIQLARCPSCRSRR